MTTGRLREGVGGTLVSTLLGVRGVEQHFENGKRFAAIDDLIEVVPNGVPDRTTRSDLELSMALQHGNQRSVWEHVPTISGNTVDDVRRNRCLVTSRANAADVQGYKPFSFDPSKA